MTDNQQDARHPASVIQIQQAYQRGEFPKSQELATSLQIFCGVVAAYLFTIGFVYQFEEFVDHQWSNASVHLQPETISQRTEDAISQLIWLLAPLLGASFVFGFMAHLIQNTTFAFMKKPLFDVSNLNPAKNLTGIFSSHNLTKGSLNFPKVILVGAVIVATFWSISGTILELPYQPIDEMMKQMIDTIFFALLTLSIVLLAVSAVDYAVERFHFFQRLRMTDEQLREENRLQNIDPTFVARRQEFYREIL